MKLGLRLGIDSAGGGGIPFKSDLNLRLVGRSGLDMVDDFGNNAKILPSTAYFDGTSYYYRSGIRPGTANAAGFIEAVFYYDGSHGLDFFMISTTTTATRYFFYRIQADGKLILQMREPTAAPEIFTIAYRATNALSAGFYIARITAGATLQFNVNGIDIAGGYTSGTGVKWIKDVSAAFANNIAIGAIKQSNITTVNTGMVFSVNHSDENKWILHGQGLYALDCIGNIDIPWVGAPSYRYDINASQHLMDVGYSVFAKTGQLDEIVPYTSANTPVLDANKTAYLTTYTRIQDVDGVALKHNLAPSVIDFDYLDSGTAVNFDRSNATMFADAARTGHDYDAANTFRWNAKDIANPKTYYTWRNTGHKGKVMSKLNQEDEVIYSLDEVLSYVTDKINNNTFRVAKFCLIDDYFIKENGVPIYDVNGDMTILTDFITANNFLVSPTIDKIVVYERLVDFVEDDSPHFRIPFCEVTNNETFIAGSDVRHGTSNDFTKTDSAIKLSSDGITFGVGIKVILNNEVDAKSRVGSNIILKNPSTNRIYVFSHSVDNHTEEALSGVVINDLIWDFFYRYSDDNGVTWSGEVSLKSLLSESGSNLMLPGGSNKGIVLANGTLVVPIYEARQSTNQLETGEDWQVRGGFIYSTNGGNI